MNKIKNAIMYLAFATLLAQIIGIGFLVSSGKLGQQQMNLALALLHGTDLVPKDSIISVGQENQIDTDQPSFTENERVRDLIFLDINAKKQAVEDRHNELINLENRLREQLDTFDRVEEKFDKKKSEDQKKAQIGGEQEFRRIVEQMQSKQAKDELLRMYKDNDVDGQKHVVVALRSMDEAKRKRIVDEFKSDEDRKTLHEILKRIRDPRESALEETGDKIDGGSLNP